MTRHISRALLTATASLVLAAGAVSTASADTVWRQDHPSREQVNHRLHNQSRRIREERREGEISARRAHHLHRADRRIRGEERRFARHHHGHISRAEQARLNHQEDRASEAIGR